MYYLYIWVTVHYSMVEIKYKPIEQIEVHEIIKQPLDTFIKMKIRPLIPNTLPPDIRWANGIVFVAAGYPPTEKLVNDQLEGTIHWANVEFAEMKDFQQMLSNKEYPPFVRRKWKNVKDVDKDRFQHKLS